MLTSDVTAPVAPAPERRKESRTTIRRAAKLRPVHPVVLPKLSVVLMEESPSGAALLAPEPLIYGSLVQVLEGGTVRLAEVRHCHLEGEGYRIGLRILACYHAR